VTSHPIETAPDFSEKWEAEPDRVELRRSYEMFQTQPGEALQRLEILAGRGSLMSMLYLAWAYEEGSAIEKDLKKAEHWYQRASERGSVHATHNLGILYWRQKAYKQAIDAFRINVAKNYPPSMNFLAHMYYQSEGIARDKATAKGLWERAISSKNFLAKRNYSKALMSGGFGVLSIPKGVYLLLSVLGDISSIAQMHPNDDRLI
jgi:TPR repeat protein